MIITVINKALKTVQIIAGTGTYTCPTKIINGELFFRFKNEWHEVAKFVTETTRVFKG